MLRLITSMKQSKLYKTACRVQPFSLRAQRACQAKAANQLTIEETSEKERENALKRKGDNFGSPPLLRLMERGLSYEEASRVRDSLEEAREAGESFDSIASRTRDMKR